jgi:sn-glycerol 3-phosphate transport system ATP-binding protein
MNVLPGEADGRLVRLANGAAVETGVEARGAVMLGVRPEHLVPDHEGALAVETAMSEPLGANTLVHGTLAGDGAEVVASLAGVHRESELQGALRFAVAPEDTHVFDARTGRRLEAVQSVSRSA